MKRSFLVKAHLVAAAFFAPVLLLMALSGGAYLIGQKGDVVRTPVTLPANTSIDSQSPTLEADVRELLRQIDPEFDFEYLKINSTTLITRPTSRVFYELDAGAGALAIRKATPNLISRLIELHKGHGPGAFKEFQKFMAAALMFILISGLWLGLASTQLRTTSAVTALGGLIVALLLAF